MNALRSLGTELSWQGAVVLLLLLLPIIASYLFRKIPRDLLFTIAALLTAFAGVVTSNQLFQSGINQAAFTVLGLWLIGKAMQQQGVFHDLLRFLSPRQKESSYLPLFFQAMFFGAFLHHRYLPLTALRQWIKHAEKWRNDLRVFGFPFFYLLLLGGLATAIGTPTNILFLSLYFPLLGDVSSHFFAVFPLAIAPILVSVFVLLYFKQKFRKPFPQFLEAKACGVILPDSLLIGREQPMTNVREGKAFAKPLSLQSGDLVVFNQPPRKPLFFQVAVFCNSIFSGVLWKKWTVVGLFLGALFAVFCGMAMGNAFLLAGILALVIRAFPLKETFANEFPLPALLEIFSAYVFFYAMQGSKLNASLASLVAYSSAWVLLPLAFILAQLLAHFMPRPIAFASLFSIALAAVFHPAELLLIGVNLAFATAVPLFGKPLTDEMALSTAISGTASLKLRLVLIAVLFASVVIPSCLLWS